MDGPLNSGASFEAATRRALQMMGYIVDAEQLVGSIRVDLLAHREHFGQLSTTAVECKDWARALRKKDLQGIWLQYEELLTTGDVRELLIVSRKPASAAAQAWLRRKPQISARTLSDIEIGVLDLSQYTPLIASEFDNSPDEIARFYVPLQTEDGNSLQDEVAAWIDGTPGRLDPHRPVAVLAAYGSGKSSFATKLASDLAKRSLHNPRARVPVLVRLGEFVSEQSLEGLLGNLFGAKYRVGNYSFATVETLAKDGRFVFILGSSPR